MAEATIGDAEAWWATASDRRKLQVYRWLHPQKGVPAPVEGQMSLLGDLDPEVDLPSPQP